MAWPQRLGWGVAASAWLLALGGGLGAMHAYSARPGTGGHVIGSWPEGSAIERERAGPTVVLFVHPRCPCTRATMANLRSVWPGAEDGTRTTLVIVSSGPGAGLQGAEQEGSEVEAWVARLGAAVDVRVMVDVAGEEARRFGVTTSGHVIVADADGRVRFSGGVTPGRGHEGACDALGKFESALAGEGAFEGGSERLTVFGCPIFGGAPLGLPDAGTAGGACCGRAAGSKG